MLGNSCLSVTGEDARDFLQAQLTCDVDDLDDAPSLAGWCNPKGRVVALFHARRTPDGIRLAVPDSLADPVLKRLLMFRFRAKVDIAVTAAAADDLMYAAGNADDDAWRLRLVESGIPYVGEAQSEEFTPHMLNLDLLGAVSFDKGCYPGQEIVARTHYRGASKRRLLRFSTAAAPLEGDKIQAGARDVGEVVNVAGNTLLAVVPVAATGLSIGGRPLTREPLPYSLETDAPG